MEKNMELAIMGYTGTTIRIHSNQDLLSKTWGGGGGGGLKTVLCFSL